jgi:hypothetical protein
VLPSYVDLTFQGNPDLTRLQDTVSKSLRRLLGVELLDGVLVQNVSLSVSAPTLVAHGLDRAIVGWMVVDITAPAKVYRVQGSAAMYPPSILPLQADATTTVAVWVF